MGKRSGGDPITNTANRARMGMDAYRLVNDASARETRPGMSRPKTGNAKGGQDPGAGTATHRGQVSAQATLGAQYRITAKRTPYAMGDPMAPTQANGRIVPSVTGSSRNFRSNW